MNCQCQGIEELFDQQHVNKELARYRSKGPSKTTSMLADAVKKEGVEGLTLLDIGGGVGAIQHELIEAGVQQVIDVDASSAYIAAAREEAQRRGQIDRVRFHHGNFVDLATAIPPADIVTLDRVICCFDDMEQLVSLSAARARKFYGLVFPRDTWWLKVGLALGNWLLRLRRSDYRGFVHPTEKVDALLQKAGFQRKSFRRTLIWQVVTYTR